MESFNRRHKKDAFKKESYRRSRSPPNQRSRPQAAYQQPTSKGRHDVFTKVKSAATDSESNSEVDSNSDDLPSKSQVANDEWERSPAPPPQPKTKVPSSSRLAGPSGRHQGHSKEEDSSTGTKRAHKGASYSSCSNSSNK
jgi:hypothetical protein